MALFRPPASPQVIVAGLALFVTGASGPVVPASNVEMPVQAQPWAYAAAQPRARAPIVSPAAAVPPGQLAQGRAADWPYATQQPMVELAAVLPVAIGTQIPPSPVLRVAQPAFVPVQQPVARAIPPAPAQVPFAALPQLSQATWPYVTQQPWLEIAALVPNLGTKIPPGQVAMAPRPQAAQAQQLVARSMPSAPTQVPFATLPQLGQATWPYATQQPWLEIAALVPILGVQILRTPVVLPPVQPWPYAVHTSARPSTTIALSGTQPVVVTYGALVGNRPHAPGTRPANSQASGRPAHTQSTGRNPR